MRTPLAVIASTTELMMGMGLPDKAHERLRRSNAWPVNPLSWTDALLLLSRSERQAPVRRETTDVARVAEQVIDISRPHLGNKPVEVRLEVEEPLLTAAPSSVVAVAPTNLISNAFKYTQAGRSLRDHRPRSVAVEDTGPGIAAEDAERLFERGERGTTLAWRLARPRHRAPVRILRMQRIWHRTAGGAVATPVRLSSDRALKRQIRKPDPASSAAIFGLAGEQAEVQVLQLARQRPGLRRPPCRPPSGSG
ncbi:sensor histidine kinase [Dokdonella sp.]|uniref:sensor histidine kinase n=1 Tax=Dokdonella sp. TaxID=2291710 RepID=UPI00352864C3